MFSSSVDAPTCIQCGGLLVFAVDNVNAHANPRTCVTRLRAELATMTADRDDLRRVRDQLWAERKALRAKVQE